MSKSTKVAECNSQAQLQHFPHRFVLLNFYSLPMKIIWGLAFWSEDQGVSNTGFY